MSSPAPCHHHHLAGLGQEEQVAAAGLPVLGDGVAANQLLPQALGDRVPREEQVVEASHQEVERLRKLLFRK